MLLFRLRRLVAGELAGAWDKFGGSGAQLRFLSTHLEDCAGNNMEVLARLGEEECDFLAHMAPSSVGPHEICLIIPEPGRDCRLRVLDEQRRPYHARMAHPGTNRKPPQEQ